MYWPQVRMFDERTLRQNSGNQAAILTKILRFQDQVGAPGISVARARHLAPDEFRRLVREVEWILVEMPLPKLQRVGSEQVHFLYRINWSDDVRRSTFTSRDFDNAIRFIGNAGEDLVRLAPFVRPLVQREWSGLVARFNGLAEARLEQFLFGAPREAIAHLAEPLLELQGGNCFYCGRRVRQRRQVDHFVPWSRHPDDGLDNLVVTDAACNGAKRDHLAAAEHVERWAERNQQRELELAQIADFKQWSHRPRRTLSVARSIYLRLPSDARLWQAQTRVRSSGCAQALVGARNGALDPDQSIQRSFTTPANGTACDGPRFVADITSDPAARSGRLDSGPLAHCWEATDLHSGRALSSSRPFRGTTARVLHQAEEAPNCS